MRFAETNVAGVLQITLDPALDERGTFTRTFSASEFRQRGLVSEVSECSTSFNHVRGTLRGLHYQSAPYEETKLVRCVRGSVFDVVADLRRDSPTYLKWYGTTLKDHLQLYIPRGVAHGFITLEDSSEVHYQIADGYRADAAEGIRWDDPTLAIEWPLSPTVMSERDSQLPYLVP